LFHHIDLILDVNIFLYLSPQGKQTLLKRQNGFCGYFLVVLYARAYILSGPSGGALGGNKTRAKRQNGK